MRKRTFVQWDLTGWFATPLSCGQMWPDGLTVQKAAFEVSGDRLVLTPTSPDEHWRVTNERD